MMNFLPKEETGFRIPAFVLQRPVSICAKLLYALLCANARTGCDCENKSEMARQLGCEVAMIEDCLKELVREKLVVILASSDPDLCIYSLKRSNEFTLPDSRDFKEKDIAYLQRIKYALINNFERRRQRRVQMILCREKISLLINTGVTLATMHKALTEEGDFIGTYAQFVKGVRKDLPDLHEKYFAVSPRRYLRKKKQ